MISATAALRMEDKFVRYKRTSSLCKLLEQARHRHYSTFSQYSKSELSVCLLRFEKNIRNGLNDPDDVGWTDENVMLTVRKG
jgi:hypothetical protein